MNVMVPNGASRTTFNDADDDDGDEESRRIEYLRRHRAMLEQKQRLETERRVDEFKRDQASIKERESKVREAAHPVEQRKSKMIHSSSLPTLKTPHETDLVGMYTKFDTLSHDTLRKVAEMQALRDMAPLNTRGKYHARFMKDAYPIAGTQLKIERERDLILGAKKKLVLAKASSSNPGSVEDRTRVPQQQGAGMEPLPYRKLDFHVDRFTTVLQGEEKSVHQADQQRKIRLSEVEHREGLEHFWLLMFHQRYHEVVAWLKSHRFRDVNVPAIVHKTPAQKGANAGTLTVELDRDFGQTPLMAASSLHHVDIVRALLDQGAATYICTANGDTAMHFLWRGWREQSLSSLQSTAQQLVQADRSKRILELLISHEADVNHQNAFGETAIQHCARLGLIDCTELLLAHGADPFLQDRHGQSALSYAKSSHHLDLVKLMQNYATVERVKAKERERRRCIDLLNEKRGALTADWSPSRT